MWKSFLYIENSIYICPMKSFKEIMFNYSKSQERERAKEAGFFDGRFKTKVVTPKTKKPPKHKHKLFNE